MTGFFVFLWSLGRHIPTHNYMNFFALLNVCVHACVFVQMHTCVGDHACVDRRQLPLFRIPSSLTFVTVRDLFIHFTYMYVKCV